MKQGTLTIVIVDDPVLISVHVDGHRTENDVRETRNYFSNHRVIFRAHLLNVVTDDTEWNVKEEVGLKKGTNTQKQLPSL